MRGIRKAGRILAALLSISLALSGLPGYGVLSVMAEEYREGDIIYLDYEVREASDEAVNEWAIGAGLTEEDIDPERICTKMDLIRILWLRNCRPEYKAAALTTRFADVAREDIYPALWAYNKGISAVDAQKKFKPDTELTHGDVLRTLWFVSGKPVATEDITGFEYLDPSANYYDAVLWAAEQKLLIRDERTNFDGSVKCRLIDAVRYIYYQYHVRATFPITREQFVQAVENVTIEARENGLHYGDSDGTPPTSDGYISCDRLVAKALWDLGYTDQTPGGFANGYEDIFSYMPDHGFIQSYDINDIGYGSIVCTTAGAYGHTFVVVSWDPETGEVVKYDEGSEARIYAIQPFTETWTGEDFKCVFNIPD